MRYLLLASLAFGPTLFAQGTAAALLGKSLSAKYDCTWGTSSTEGGSLRVFEDTDNQRAKVLIEKHRPSGDTVETETAWFEGPQSTVANGVYILGSGRLLLNGAQSRLVLTKLGVDEQVTCVSAEAVAPVCEGWYQEAGKKLEKAKMASQFEADGNVLYTVSHQGYDYRVQWHKNLTTFYVSISKAGARVLSTTARVPSDNHPENFTDLNLPGGPRLSVNCERK